MIDEQTLLERIKLKDMVAFEMLYEQLKSNVFSLAFQMLKSREDAEEVLQDTFSKVFKKADSFKANRGSVRAFIYTIARNECISRIRKQDVRPKSSDIDIETLSTLSPHGQNDTFSSSAKQQEEKLYAESALEILTEEERNLVLQAFFYGYSHGEIAKQTGLPLGTVKSKLRKSLTRMKTHLEQETERSKHEEDDKHQNTNS